ncbi:MAG: hypothetical protein EXQ47_11310 [Bryobacterales bacterium]|nr:hypothetical protein [Bryobacterales bacterium]
MTTVEQSLLEAVRALPRDKQQELLDHANQLRNEVSPKKPLKSVKGLWADLNIALTAAEMEENRRELWKKFPTEL